MSHTLYRSQVGRNAKPHALPVTSRKDHGTSRFTGHKLEGTRNLNIPHALPRYSGRKAEPISSATLCQFNIRRGTDPKITSQSIITISGQCQYIFHYFRNILEQYTSTIY
ncbi:hypothetical protein ACSBR2_028544 [Camellia fascicularis]